MKSASDEPRLQEWDSDLSLAVTAVRRKVSDAIKSSLHLSAPRASNTTDSSQPVVSRGERAKKRAVVVEMLGSRCANCGTTDIRVLQVDHKYDDGYKLKRGGRIRGFDAKHYAAIIRGEDPLNRYQLLCANCHVLKTQGYLDGPERHSAEDKTKQAV